MLCTPREEKSIQESNATLAMLQGTSNIIASRRFPARAAQMQMQMHLHARTGNMVPVEHAVERCRQSAGSKYMSCSPCSKRVHVRQCARGRLLIAALIEDSLAGEMEFASIVHFDAST